MHSDYHALWIDPADPARMWQGHDGGAGVSYNGGKTWEFIDVLPLGQFYSIFADNREPFYYVGGGLQDNATWYGPSRTGEPFGSFPMTGARSRTETDSRRWPIPTSPKSRSPNTREGESCGPTTARGRSSS